jgi:hypothetical protein
MPLTMRPTGRASPIGKDRQDFTVYCGDWPMGRIYEERGGPEDMRWFWTLYGVVGKPPKVHTNDHTPVVLPLGVDCGDHVRRGHVAICGDLLEPFPECILKADARFASGDQDGAFDDKRFPTFRHGERPGCLVFRSCTTSRFRHVARRVTPAVGGPCSRATLSARPSHPLKEAIRDKLPSGLLADQLIPQMIEAVEEKSYIDAR